MEDIEININVGGVRQAKSDMKAVVGELKNVNNMLNFMTDGMKKNLGNVQSDMKETRGVTDVATKGMTAAFAKALIAVEALKFAFGLLKKVASAAFGFLKDSIMAGANLERLQITTRVIADNMGVSNEELEQMESSLKNIRAFGSQAWRPMQAIIRTGLTPAIKEMGAEIDKSLLEAKFKKPAGEISDLEAGMFGLTEAAKNFAAASPNLVSSGDAIQKFSDFIVTGRTEILESLGITKDLTQVYIEYGRNVLGVERALTDQEKRQARLNLLMEEGEGVVGAYSAAYSTAEKNIGSMKDVMTVMQEYIGLAFQPVFSLLTGTVLTGMQSMRNVVVEKSEEMRESMGKLRDGIMGTIELFTTGDFNKEISEQLGGMAEDSPWVTMVLNARRTVGNIKEAFSGITKDDLLGAFTGINIAEQLQMGGVFDDIKTGIAELSGYIEQLTQSDTFKQMAQWLDFLIEGIGEFNSGVGEGFVSLWEEIKSVFMDELKPAFEELWDTLGTMFGEANEGGEDFKVGMREVGKVVGKAIGQIVKWGIRIVSWILKAINWYINFQKTVREKTAEITAKIAEIIDWIRSIPDRVRAKIEELKMQFTNFVNNAILSVQTFVNNAIMFIQSLPERFLFFIGQMLAYIVKFATVDAPMAIGNFIASAVAFFQSLPERISTFMQQTYERIKNWFNQAKEWAGARVQDIINFFTGIPNKANEAGQSMSQKIKAWIENAKEFVKQKIEDIKKFFTEDLPNSVQTFADKAVEFIKSIPDRIQSALDSLAQKFKDGLNIIIDGYNSVASKTPGVDTIDRLQSGTQSFRGGLAEVGEYGREVVHMPQGSRVTSSRQVRDIESNVLRKLAGMLNRPQVTVNQPNFAGGGRSSGQQMNNFNNLLINALS